MKVIKTIFLFAFLGSFTSVEGSFTYRPMGVAVENTDLAVTAHVFSYHTIDNRKYACAEPLRILHGDWNMDSTLFLPMRERPDSGMIMSTFYEILYDSNSTYLLLLKKKDGYITLVDYPWISQFKLDSSNMSLVDDMQELLRIESISDTTKKVNAYIDLLSSSYVDIRESIAWKFHKLICEEALYGLQIALKDTARMVVGMALSGFLQLGKKGIASIESAAFLESLMVYQRFPSELYLAYAAQKGEAAIPLLHSHFRTNREHHINILNALNYLKDTTALRLFEEVILYSRPWDTPKHNALRFFLIPDSSQIPFSDSVVISWAMSALSDTCESIQETAIQILENKTGLDFGYTTGWPEERAKQRAKIIKKWRKWYKDWLKEQRHTP